LRGGNASGCDRHAALAIRVEHCFLADEPTPTLYHKTGEGILRLMKELNQEEAQLYFFYPRCAVMEMLIG